MKKILLGLLFFVGIFLFALSTIPRRTYSTYASEMLCAAVASSGLFLSLQESELRGLSLHATSAKLYVPEAFTELVFNDVTISLDVLPLFLLSPTARITGKFLDGSLEGRWQTSVISSTSTLQMTLDKAKLAELPILALYGVTDGTASITLNELILSSDKIEQLKSTIALKDLRKGKSTPAELLAPLRAMIPLLPAMSLPPYGPLDIAGAVTLSGGRTLDVSDIGITLPEGEITGQVTSPDITLPPEVIPVTGEIRVSLSPVGKTTVAPFLPLLGSGNLNKNTPNFRISAKNAPLPAGLQFEPLP